MNQATKIKLGLRKFRKLEINLFPFLLLSETISSFLFSLYHSQKRKILNKNTEPFYIKGFKIKAITHLRFLWLCIYFRPEIIFWMRSFAGRKMGPLALEEVRTLNSNFVRDSLCGLIGRAHSDLLTYLRQDSLVFEDCSGVKP